MAVVGLVASFLLLWLSWFSLDGDGWWFALAVPLWLMMGLYWAYTLATLPNLVLFEAHDVVIHTWGRIIRLPYAEIEDARLAPLGLSIVTPHQQVRLSGIDATLLATIYVKLEETAPRLVAHAQQRFQQLPIHISTRWFTPILYFALGIIMTLLGIGLLSNFISPDGSFPSVEWSNVESVLMLFTTIVVLAIGLGYGYAALFRHVWRYTFTQDSVMIRYSLYTRILPATAIRTIEVGHFERMYKGFKQVVAYLEIGMEDGEKVQISPEKWNRAMGFSDTVTEALFAQLAERLRTLYLPN